MTTDARTLPPDLGLVPDATVAARLGVTRQAVHQWRTAAGIPAAQRSTVAGDGITELLLRARLELGHTQAQAAETIGVSRRTWCRLERDGERSAIMLHVVEAYLRSAGLSLTGEVVR